MPWFPAHLQYKYQNVDEDTNETVVKCMRSRGQPFDDFVFKITNGYPYVDRDLSEEGDFFNI